MAAPELQQLKAALAAARRRTRDLECEVAATREKSGKGKGASSLQRECHIIMQYNYFMFFHKSRVMTILRNIQKTCEEKGFTPPTTSSDSYPSVNTTLIGKRMSYSNADTHQMLLHAGFDCHCTPDKKGEDGDDWIMKHLRRLTETVSEDKILTIVLICADGPFAQFLKNLKCSRRTGSLNVVCVNATFRKEHKLCVSERAKALKSAVGAENLWALNSFWPYDEHSLEDFGYSNFEKLEEYGEPSPKECKRDECAHPMSCSNYHLKSSKDRHSHSGSSASSSSSSSPLLTSNNPNGRQICKFFGTKKGCHHGAKCRNQHLAPGSTPVKVIPGNDSEDEEQEEVVLLEPES